MKNRIKITATLFLFTLFNNTQAEDFLMFSGQAIEIWDGDSLRFVSQKALNNSSNPISHHQNIALALSPFNSRESTARKGLKTTLSGNNHVPS